MKKTAVVLGFFVLLVSPLMADAPDFDSINVRRSVCISNASEVPGMAVVAFTQEADNVSGSWHVKLLENGSWVDTPDYREIVSIVAIPFNLMENKSIKEIDFPRLIASGRITPVYILQPRDDYYPDFTVSIHNEDVVYRVGCISDNRIFLDLESVEREYTSGKKTKTVFLQNPPEILRRDKVVRAAAIRSSNTLQNFDFPMRYEPQAAFDGNPETGWSEGVDGPGYGQWIEVELESPLTVDSIVVSPGWFQKALFEKNHRISWMDIYLDDKKFEARFTDRMVPQTVKLDSPVQFRKARFVIRDIYPTGKWNDTPIAEIVFMRQGKTIKVEYSHLYPEITDEFDLNGQSGK